MAATVGCGGDPLSPITPADVTSSYVLASIDGVRPPIPFISTSTIIADSVTFNADGTWTEVEVNGVRGGGMNPTRVARYTGTWRLDAARRVLFRSSQVTTENAFDVVDQGRALIFRRPPPPNDWRVWRYERGR